MENNKVNITLNPDAKGKYPDFIPPITILEGEPAKALPLRERLKIKHTGIISSPGDWNDKRKLTPGFDPLNVSVVANFTSRTILLVIDEKDSLATEITGVLKLHPELEALNINSSSVTYDEKGLLDKLVFFERYFVGENKYAALVESLKKFEVEVQMNFKNTDDFKGTKGLQKAYAIKHAVPLAFTLNMPVFAGGENRTFDVDVNLSISGSTVYFWLRSVDLHKAIQMGTEDIFQKELDRLADYAIVKQY